MGMWPIVGWLQGRWLLAAANGQALPASERRWRDWLLYVQSGMRGSSWPPLEPRC